VQATIDRITFDVPVPEGLVTKVEVNSGQQVPIGAIQRSKGETADSSPAQISGVVQIVVWFEPQQAGIEYFTPSTTIQYSVDGQDYEAKYPVGVGICSVEKVTAKTPCDADAGPSDLTSTEDRTLQA
jgi:hypothetical protein